MDLFQKKPSTPKRGSPKKMSKKQSSGDSGSLDVASLSDAELAAELKKLGVDVGPILGKEMCTISQ